MSLDVAELVPGCGNLVRTRRLLAMGATRRDIAAAVADGGIERILRGWVSTPDADRDQLRAILAGGRIGCISALKRWGLWSANDQRLHLSLPANARGINRPSRHKIRDHWGRPAFHPEADVDSEMRLKLCAPGAPVTHWQRQCFPRLNELDWIERPVEALLQAIMCQDDIEQAVACADSALHSGVVTQAEWENLLGHLPGSRSVISEWVDPRADSGLESRIRVRLMALGHSVEIQVSAPEVGRLDAVVDDLVILELDGERYHSTSEQRSVDSRRMLTSLSLYGLPTVRAGYEQAIYEWDLVYSALRRQLEIAREARRAKLARGRLLPVPE